MNDRLLIMGISLLFVIGAYVLISKKDRSWFNWATSLFFLWISLYYVLQALDVIYLTGGRDGSLFGYFYCYACYAASLIGLAVGYCFLKPPRFFRFKKPAPSVHYLPLFLLILGFLLYLPVLIEFRAYLLTPRIIYERTRTGYGIYDYGSSAAVILAFITYLCKKKKTLPGAFIFYLSCIALSYFHGSKGQLLYLMWAWLIYLVYGKRQSFTIVKTAVASVLIATILSAAFYFLSRGIAPSLLILQMASYSDYTRNAVMVIDDTKGKTYYGQLTLEDEVYSRIPRAIMPNKPKDYGSFRLAEKYYPEAFFSEAGAPAFGVGVQYADFGVFAILWLTIIYTLTGWLASGVIAAYRKNPSPALLVLVMYFSGVTLFATGVGHLLPEMILLAFILDWLLNVRVKGIVLRPELQS